MVSGVSNMYMGNLFRLTGLGVCWWVFLFTFGIFQTIMWTIILTGAIGIYINLKDGFN